MSFRADLESLKVNFEGRDAPDICSTCFFNGQPSMILTNAFEEERCVKKTIEEWQETAKNGCPICTTVVNGVSQTLSSIFPGEECLQLTLEPHPIVAYNEEEKYQAKALTTAVLRAYPVVNEPSKEVGDYRISLRYFRGTMDWKEALDIKFFTSERSDELPFGWGYYRPKTAGSPEAIQFAAKCLKRCENLHDCYYKTSKNMPTRVLQFDEGPQPSIRVVESAEIGKGTDSRYVALSYCWGGIVPIRLLEANYVALKLGLKWTEIPLLFQDIVHLIQKLTRGVRFLWIDALCIIQDSAQDWERECTQMGKVYENSYFTIAASSAENSNCSILSNPRIHWNEPLLVQQIEDYCGPQVFVQRAPQHHVQQVLDNRLWALQEHLMSSRILRYMSDEIHFECQQLIGCECEPAVHGGGNSETDDVFSLPDNLRALWKFLPYCITEQLALTIHEIWKDVVMEASARAVTYESDRLPALSGLAALLIPYMNPKSKYLAGLWSQNLVLALAWIPTGTGLPVSSRPSWSWTSIHALGGNYYSDYERYAENKRQSQARAILIDAECKIKGSNPFGEVSDGFLILEAPTRLVDLEIIPQDPADEGEDYPPYYSLKDQYLGTQNLPKWRQFAPDAEIETSPLSLAGRVTARRKLEGGNNRQGSRPESWSGLLVHLSDDIEAASIEGEPSPLSDGTQTNNIAYDSQVDGEGATFLGWANFLLLGLQKNRDGSNQLMSESGEWVKDSSFQGYCFERLGVHNVRVQNADDFEGLLGAMTTRRVYIE